MSHVDDGMLHAYLDGALHVEDPAEAGRVERHLAECDDCRARLEVARRLRAEADALMEAAVPAELDMPPFEAITARAAEHSGAVPDRAGRRRRFSVTRRLAWAASIVIALGMGWWAREMAYQPGGLPQATMERRAPVTGTPNTSAPAAEALEPAAKAPQAKAPAAEGNAPAAMEKAPAAKPSAGRTTPATGAQRQAEQAPANAAGGAKQAARPTTPAERPTTPAERATALVEPVTAQAERRTSADVPRPATPVVVPSAAPPTGLLATPAKVGGEAQPAGADAAMQERVMDAMTAFRATTWLNSPAYRVEGLEFLGVTRSTTASGVPELTVYQQLPDGRRLELHQRRAAAGTFTFPEGVTGVFRDGTLVYTRTALTPDSLGVLLGRLVPLGH